MAASRSNFAYSIEDGDYGYGSFSSTGSRVARDSSSIQEEPKTESCVGAACKKLSTIGKNIKKKFTRKKSRERLLPRLSALDEELRPSDLSDYDLSDRGGSFVFGGRRKRHRRRTRKKKGGKRRKSTKKKGGHHLYKRLGVSKYASKKQIRKAYNTLKKKRRATKNVKEAYKILSNKKKRKEYNNKYIHAMKRR